MDLSENRTSHPNIIRSANADSCVIGPNTHTSSIIIPSSDVIIESHVKSVDQIDKPVITQLCNYRPEVLILATGVDIIFPDTDVLEPLVQLNIGLEVLNNQAAARTFNILLSEDRQAVCLMLIV